MTTTKTVAKLLTVQTRYGRADIHRLKLAEFEWRNCDFDAESISACNANTMQCI